MADSNALKWTLLFKKHNATILLIVSPTQSIASIKDMLFRALKARSMTEINGDTVPESATGIELGIPIDRNDLELGWKKLEVPTQEAKDEGANKRVAGGKKSVLNLSPQGAGIRDSETLAFRFRATAQDDKEKDQLEAQLDDPGWDVIVPSYDDDDNDDGEETETER